jgi:hypothetical protein
MDELVRLLIRCSDTVRFNSAGEVSLQAANELNRNIINKAIKKAVADFFISVILLMVSI